MGRAERISEVIKSHDYKLFCKGNREGKLCVFREGTRTETYDVEGKTVHFVRSAPHFIFALTHNWLHDGESVDWGIEPILKRLRDMDLWHKDVLTEITDHNEKVTKSNVRAKENEIEAFLYEWRDHFKKHTNDINVAGMKENKKRKEEF